MTGLIIAIVVLGIAVIVLIVLLLSRKPQDYTQSFALIQQRVSQIEEQVKRSVDDGSKAVGAKFEDSLKVIGEIKKTIGSLEQANKQMLDIGKDIASLQDLLKPPQVRGGFGELTLGRILSDLLPGRNFEEQYRFKNGSVVDAVIKIGDRLVPIDSKFPLESFQRCITCSEENEKRAYLKDFTRSVRTKIDDISAKYILEDEGTYGFALMYIPSENVYYQTIIKEDFEVEGKSISEYALSKRVVIVSPNTIYAYLRVICIGLNGMHIESNAKTIMEDFGRLKKEFEKFEKEFRVLGSHIHDTQETFGRADRQLDKFGMKLHSMDSSEAKAIEEPDKPT